MLEVELFEGKTKEEALEKALLKYQTDEKHLFIKEEFIEGKLFKSSKYKLTILQKEEVKKYIEDYFNQLGKYLKVNINSEIHEEDSVYNILLISDNNKVLIGKEGKNLQAIQYFIRQSLATKTNFKIKVNIDISNYKLNKLKKLEREIKKIAKEVQNTKIDSSLDPMNSYERRYIHTLISKFDNLETESVGEGKERHIIIKYKED